ncbi:TRAP transporter small permease [Microbaculum marinum]|uniref:TRAP transporter small permease protein n=1 Tax=Microbaculum marinum TaxID=1764581 RepID=A0AAW9RM62_9HYPH
MAFGQRIAGLPSWMAGIALFFLMVMTFCDVVLRSSFDSPIEAATELTRICMAIIVFASLPVISARGGHISVDLLDPFFRGWGERLRDAAVDIVCGVILIWPANQAFVLAARARDYGDLTESLGIPQFYIEYFIAIFTSLTVVVLILRGLIELVGPAALHTDRTVYKDVD